jgi:hypothetical protein
VAAALEGLQLGQASFKRLTDGCSTLTLRDIITTIEG